MSQSIPFYNPLDTINPRTWPEYKLIMPICAVGNIGQLACDLIISTLLDRKECQLIGRIYSPALMPIVGPNAFTLRGPPTSSTEVYESKKHKIIIIQQRTSYFKNLKQIYIRDLVDWIKESKFDSVLVLTSSFAQSNPDTTQLGDPSLIGSLNYIKTSFFQPDDKWTKLNLKSVPDPKNSKLVKEDGLTYLAGSGMTKPLLKAFEKAFIPAAFLVDFCSEGVNMADCYEVANTVDSLIGLGYGRDSNRLPEQFQKIILTQSNYTPSTTITTTSSSTIKSSHGYNENNDLFTNGDWIQPFSWTISEST